MLFQAQCPQCRRSYPVPDGELGQVLPCAECGAEFLRHAQFHPHPIEKKLGGGGMGTVYLARDTRLADRPVALKVVHPHLADDPELKLRFRREAEAAALLDHPNICPILDASEHGGISYLAMKYIDGRPL